MHEVQLISQCMYEVQLISQCMCEVQVISQCMNEVQLISGKLILAIYLFISLNLMLHYILFIIFLRSLIRKLGSLLLGKFIII